MSFTITAAACRSIMVKSLQHKRQPSVELASAVIDSRSFSDEAKQKIVKVKKKNKGAVVEEGGRDRMTELLIRAFDAPSQSAPPASEEEMARRHEIGRNYVIGCFSRHNETNHDLNCKIRMKNHAINMLPRNSWIKEEALKISDEDDALPPMWRSIPVDTPPIPGFDPAKLILEDEQKK
uniref:Uncharacterized protein n=1 Tax=Eucampia antarctica TaxID=49252 RepID=A0A7S2WNR0_9STRA|mmetsp:Transcript_7611/g.7163  ORF Transcript_7611/g.7163 Transcript_7611/m.7163 type:complete len:179 (+) Transcript_7611:181-717(+)